MRKLDASPICDMVVRLAISKEQGLIATGNQQGLVMIWDLETSKLDYIHVAAKDSITVLEFLEDYPILVAAG